MKNHLVILLFIISLCYLPDSKTFGQGFSITHDFCTDTTVTSSIFSCLADSSQCFIEGVTQTDGVSPQHGYLASYGYNGNLLWDKKILFPGTFNSSQSYSGLHKIGADRYLFLGEIYDYAINPNYSVWYPFLYFFNKNGDSLGYSVLVDSFKLSYFSDAIYYGDNIVAVGAKSSSQVPNTTDIWLCKFDTLGNLKWEKKFFNSATNPEDIHIELSADRKHYIICGPMIDPTINLFGSTFAKIDTSGNVVWVRSLQRPYFSVNYMDIVANPSGGYYFVSSICMNAAMAPDSSHIYYGKLNENGDTLWTKNFRADFFNCYGYLINWTPDHKALVMQVGPYSNTKGGAMKIDTSGNILWHRIYEHLVSNVPLILQPGHFQSLSVTPDNRYLLGGVCFPGTGFLSWLCLTDSNGCRNATDPSCDPLKASFIELPEKGPSVYPNPVSDKLQIINTAPNDKISVYDINSRLLSSTTAITDNKNQIIVSDYIPGIYYVKILRRSTIFTFKFIRL